jgi:beta-phosphoglucomutase
LNECKKWLALFDFDGTLFDTNDVNFYAYREALKEFGYDLSRNFWEQQCLGRHYKEFLPKIINDDTMLIKTVHEKKKTCYIKYLSYAKSNNHLFKMIPLLKISYYVAIVSTASRRNVLDLLTTFGYDTLFDAIFTQEDVTCQKPDPEGYLKAMEYFKVLPQNTIIFEDSKQGLEAAMAVGGSVVKIIK